MRLSPPSDGDAPARHDVPGRGPAAWQHTLAAPLSFEGVGLHTGRHSRIRLLPAPPDHGVAFIRVDRKPGVLLAARPQALVSTPRCTALGEGDQAVVLTVEHLMAALAGMAVDNVRVEVEGDEIPALDGSALPYARAIGQVGRRRQEAPRRIRRIPAGRCLRVEDGTAWIAATTAQTLEVGYTFRSTRPGVATQSVRFIIEPETFLREVAPARTVAFVDEVAQLRAMGLGLGGRLDNVVLLGPEGPVTPLRFDDEVARHKVLDLVGDLALAGPLVARVEAEGSGHRLTARLVRRMVAESEEGETC